MLYEADKNSVGQFRDQVKSYGIKTWNSSESRSEETMQQLLSDDDTRSSEQPTAEILHPTQQISNENELPKETPHIGIAHFVDGSPRTVNTGYLLGEDGISYPVALAHVGAASVTFNNGSWRETGFEDKHSILVAHTLMEIEFDEISGKWKLEDPTDNIEEGEIDKTDAIALRAAAVRRARRNMALSERRLVKKLTENFPEAWIALDGTLFSVEGMYSDLKVIGISKSFRHNPRVIQKDGTQDRMGNLSRLLINLEVGWRSPVYILTPEKNRPKRYTYMWFIRIHGAQQKPGQSPVSGIVKVELPPSKCYHQDEDLRVQTIDAISHAIFRLRYPYQYDNRRGESFLYPIYIAESLVKSKLNSVEIIQGIWKSSQYEEEN